MQDGGDCSIGPARKRLRLDMGKLSALHHTAFASIPVAAYPETPPTSKHSYNLSRHISVARIRVDFKKK
eukprot:2219296-Amphidinium_carterae.1